MNMDFRVCKEYKFTQGKLVSHQSGREYAFRLDRNDRFYSYIKPYIVSGGVSSLTKLMIDTITITDIDKTFFTEQSFSLITFVLAKDNNDVCWAYELSINNIKINSTNVSKQSYKQDCFELDLYEMEIPYQTSISIKERLD